MEQLRGMNAKKMFQKVSLSDNDFMAWMQQVGLISASKKCSCGGDMALRSKGSAGGRRWVCRNSWCRKKKGILKGSFFENTKLAPQEVFQLSYYWCRGTHTVSEIQFDMRREDGSTIGAEAIVDWNKYFRDVCAEFFVKNPMKTGGEGKVVDIDEILLIRRKYKGGHQVKEQWTFCGIEYGSARCFLVPVENCSAATLLPIIQEYVLPGSTVISDLWAAYGGINNLPDAYRHLTLDYSIHFVEPGSSTRKITAESTWQKFKHSHRCRYRTQRTMLLSYIEHFQWRHLFAGDDAMYHLWSQICSLYPLE
ncbi:hypothetical protein AB6A40_005056 [Gnathostoma spinigerum]|uniref:ISXO2-like transposase domain-containing protein n=1 Tax=Gnathostoma spinigerum TaxID=75299 RepID=A0ABD6ENU7_9BILA